MKQNIDRSAPLCKDCRFISRGAWCAHPRSPNIEGDGRKRVQRCARMRDKDHPCGLSGNLYEPKETGHA